jgi:5-methylcytosine-specific restriction endonuclease McrA
VRRKALTKGLRFEVFKRDGFVCRYCGRKPPEVVLHVDHLLPVSKGGENELGNLISACRDCNAGKSARLLGDVPAPLEIQAIDTSNNQKRMAELKEYREKLLERQRFLEDSIEELKNFWAEANQKEDFFAFDDDERRSIVGFLKLLPVETVIYAMATAAEMVNGGEYSKWRYFCGTCWNIIRKNQEKEKNVRQNLQPNP